MINNTLENMHACTSADMHEEGASKSVVGIGSNTLTYLIIQTVEEQIAYFNLYSSHILTTQRGTQINLGPI